ncbi:MAG: hypothetical protein KGO96_07510 [Elusimicrobia bacterium]|nr:hypothetical protein [Elusimicrobiota bacterium]
MDRSKIVIGNIVHCVLGNRCFPAVIIAEHDDDNKAFERYDLMIFTDRGPVNKFGSLFSFDLLHGSFHSVDQCEHLNHK